jgi:hypothetical protein
VRPLTLKSPGVSVALLCEQEHEPIEGNASAVDAATDRETADWIRDQLESGNDWAWCCAHVVVRYERPVAGEMRPAVIEGHAYLGCCSYESREAFMAPDGYYPGMIQEALDSLNAQRRALLVEGSDVRTVR